MLQKGFLKGQKASERYQKCLWISSSLKEKIPANVGGDIMNSHTPPSANAFSEGNWAGRGKSNFLSLWWGNCSLRQMTIRSPMLWRCTKEKGILAYYVFFLKDLKFYSKRREHQPYPLQSPIHVPTQSFTSININLSYPNITLADCKSSNLVYQL